jgi:hypothetical protein
VLLVPVIALLAFGVIEFGIAWQDRLTVESAVRAGVRVGSTEGSASTADTGILMAVGAALNDVGLSNVNHVVVYKSGSTDGAVPAACLTPAPHSVSGSCNAYSGAQLQQVAGGTAPASWFGCGAGSLDASWCPASRQSIQALGSDYLGVWVSANHAMLTGFFGSAQTLTDRAVMRLEPQGG